MSILTEWLQLAQAQGASDIHFEPEQPIALRICGQLHMQQSSLSSKQIAAIANHLIGPKRWPTFLEQRSYDLSTCIEGARCRINIMQTSRGVGMVIRLLSSFHSTLQQLNLHPEIKQLLDHKHGLILVCGPTGSGKSTTIAGFVHEINVHQSQHIITIEHPIEYIFHPESSLIRQREVGRDTPSFERALIDSMREDPDILVVGEMRETETMRLTLNAAETGHLVFSTVHSSTCVEALQRIISAFPATIQENVRSQLADCLVAVICQRLVYREDLGMRIPECEVLTATTGIRAHIRQGHFARIPNAMETGREYKMWSRRLYQKWLYTKTDWCFPEHRSTSDLLAPLTDGPLEPFPQDDVQTLGSLDTTGPLENEPSTPSILDAALKDFKSRFK